MHFQKNGKNHQQDIVSIEDRAFIYGDGCFTTMRYSESEIQLWEHHFARLKHATHTLRMNFDLDRLNNDKNIFLNTIRTQQISDYGTIKIVISRGVSKRGYALPLQPCDLYFYFYPAKKINNLPSTLDKVGLIEPALSSTFELLKGIKSLNRLEQVMLKSLAAERSWDEALCFDIHGHLVEGIASNCFLLINGMWITPDLAVSGIDGVMRKEILQRMKYYEIPHQVRIISRGEIRQATAGFLCNALNPMQMLSRIDMHAEILDFNISITEHLFLTLHLTDLV